MAFRDLDEFLVVPPLVLPIRGKRYEFPGAISARSWLLLQRVSNRIGDASAPEDEVLSEAEELELRAEMFGGIEPQMIEDGLSTEHIRVTFYTLLAFHLSGRDAAELYWNAQGEAPASSRTTRRQETTKSTRSRGSTAGSTSPKTRRAKAASPGAKSSATGS
jgi:hypothetical protein